MVVTAAALIAVPVAKCNSGAQDKYSLISPSGIPYADFRGYEDWAVVSTAKTDSDQGNRRESEHDQRIQVRSSRQRPAFP